MSLFTGGAFFGAMFAGPVGDYIGRRWTIFLGALIFLIGGTFQTAAQNLQWLWGGRAIAGLGVGFLVMIIPVYQGEIAHPSIRGRVTALQQFMLGIGSFVAGWLSYGTFPIKSSGAYRSMSHPHKRARSSGQIRALLTWLPRTTVPLAIQLVPAIVLAALILGFPESPRWLIDHGHPELGLKTLAKLHANGNTEDPWVKAEFAQIEEAITYDHEHEAKSYLELFRSR